ncbi:MAG: amidohydrolase [Clostridiales bacterium]|nr:amidohydrolase [Candidatus Crickella equi]
MLFKDITILDENFEVREHMYVGVKDAFIKYVGDKMPEEDFGEVYDGKNRFLMPSMYNMHSHNPMVLMRGYGENVPLQEWLNELIFPFEGHLTEDDMYWGALMGVAESVRYGIGSSTDMYLNENALGRAYSESGFKANFSNCVMCFDDSDYKDLPIYKSTLDAIKNWDGYDDGRIHAEFSLHAEYTSNEKIARQLAEVCIANNSSMHVHVSETAGEVQECKERHDGKSPVKYLADCGIFDRPTVAAHCVHVDDDDIEILREKNVTVASCPKSNLKLASGIAPVYKLMQGGVNVTIGTDSVASNNCLNMIEEIRDFNLLQKGSTGIATAIDPRETIFAATRGGAVGQQRMDCGIIKEGFRADIAVLDTDTVYNFPQYNLLNNLVYSFSGNDVVLTMIDGRVMYRDGMFPTLDLERIKFECSKSIKRILGELNK